MPSVRPLRPLLLAVVLVHATAVVPAAVAEVYRYKDERGNWVYADRPPASGQSAESLPVKSGAVSPRIAVEPRSANGAVDLVAVNECRCVVEFAIKVRGGDGQERAATAVVPERSRQVLLAVPTTPGTGTIAFDYGYVIGRPGAVHAPGPSYRAPFAIAQSFAVSQAPPLAITHRDAASRNAIDIAMPVGTADARRARGPRHQRRAPVLPRRARHRDQRRGELRAGPARRRHARDLCAPADGHDSRAAGQRVERGEYIANSGNTGSRAGRTCTSSSCATPASAASRCRSCSQARAVRASRRGPDVC